MYSRMSWAATSGRRPTGAQQGLIRFMRPKRASSTNMMRRRCASQQPDGPSSQHQESRFFKIILGREVALGMMWTRHQFTPAMPMQKVVDRAVAGRVTDGFLVGNLEIMDVQQFAGAGRFGKTRQQRLFFGHRHVLVFASTIWLGLERLDATVVIGHVRAVHRT